MSRPIAENPVRIGRNAEEERPERAAPPPVDACESAAELQLEGVLTELESAVRGLHARGVVHLDLRHRSNVLVARDGRPVLIDFASAVCFRPGGLGARLLLPWLARVDLQAYRKWEIRLRDQGTGADCPAAGPSKGPRGASRPTK